MELRRCGHRHGVVASLGLLLACGDAESTGDAGVSPASERCDFSLMAGSVETSKSGVSIELVQTEPDPPARFLNDWRIRLDAEALDSTSGADLDVEPFMPAHGHGAGTPVPVHDMEDDGLYDLQGLNLWMGGHWEVRIGFKVADLSDRVVFDVCIPD